MTTTPLGVARRSRDLFFFLLFKNQSLILMQVKNFTLLVGLLFLASSTLFAQIGNPCCNPAPTPTPAPTLPPTSSTTTTVNCPTNAAGCDGDCIFTVTISSEAGDSCEANRVDVTFSANSTGANCTADYDRAAGGGEISYTLCSGEDCSLDEDNFPDGSFWPPYVNGDSIPAGKDSISQACRDAIDIGGRPPGPPYSLFWYRFTGVSSVDPDFGIQTLCYCNGDTTVDTIIVKVDTVKAEVVETTGGDDRGGEGGDVTGGNRKTHEGPFAQGSSFVVSNIFPNPTSDNLNVVFQAYEASHVTILVHDQLGKRVKETIKMLDVGDNLFTLDVTDLKQGFYYMTLIGSYDDKVVLKFIHN